MVLIEEIYKGLHFINIKQSKETFVMRELLLVTCLYRVFQVSVKLKLYN